MRDANPETITGTLWWYKILPLIVFNIIRVKQNLHMRGKKPIKILGTVASSKSCVHGQLGGIWESMWGFVMKSPHFTSSIRDKWHRWKSRPTSKGRYVSSIATVRTLLAHGKTLYERRFGEPFKGPNNAFWSNGWISSVFTERSDENSSIWQKKTF